MRTRRRRRRGTWLPAVGTAIPGAEDGALPELQFTIGVAATLSTIISPLLLDDTPDADAAVAAGSSLSDIIGSEYVLERIVGKLHASRVLTLGVENQDSEPAVLLGCGFFVARKNDDASGGGTDTPIGSASVIERNSNYSPLELDTTREPWIWRRTWLLGNSGGILGFPDSAEQSQLVAGLPSSTVGYGSVLDGPHIDSKVKRRIRSDDRLWFAVSTITFPVGATPTVGIGTNVVGRLDYRTFGSLRRARNTSAF